MAQPQHIDPEQATQVAAAGGNAAATAAENQQTPAEAQAATEAAMRAEADAKGVSISDEDIQKIAEGTIKLLEARGAFEQAPTSTTEHNAPPSNSSEPTGDGSEGSPANGSATPPASPPAAPSSEEPPKKKTWAERFQGK